MTICDYIVTMNEVRIAELKARLSEYLRRVRRGHVLTVLDRDRPVARLVPYQESEPVRVRQPLGRVSALREVPLPPALAIDFDVEVVTAHGPLGHDAHRARYFFENGLELQAQRGKTIQVGPIEL